MAAPVSLKISPFKSAGVRDRLLLARLRGLSRRMAWTRSPEILFDDGVVLSGVSRALVDGLTAINAVAKQTVEEALVDQRALLVTKPVAS